MFYRGSHSVQKDQDTFYKYIFQKWSSMCYMCMYVCRYKQINVYIDINSQFSVNFIFTAQWYCFLLAIMGLQTQVVTQSYLQYGEHLAIIRKWAKHKDLSGYYNSSYICLACNVELNLNAYSFPNTIMCLQMLIQFQWKSQFFFDNIECILIHYYAQ